MNAGEVKARLYSSGASLRVAWDRGLISALEEVDPAVPEDLWVAPALIDLQINGFAGVDFQQDELSQAGLLQACAGLRSAGCSKFLLTLMTDRWEAILERLAQLRALRGRTPQVHAALAGWHIEGPFLSAAPGFCGAHNPALMIDPSPLLIRQLQQVTESDPVLLTLAPERSGALETIALATSLGMKVSLGHTNASAAILRHAMTAGATGFTHLANACPQQLDRHDNILWRVFDTPGLTASLIPDGHHVSPALFRLAHRLLQADHLYYTTDAVTAAGAPPGRYSIGAHQVVVGPDQIVRHPGQTNYAGSGLRPIDGVVRAAEMLGRRWQEVWDGFSSAPARFMGWPHGLEVGRPADLCLVRTDFQNRPSLVRTIVAGTDSQAES